MVRARSCLVCAVCDNCGTRRRSAQVVAEGADDAGINFSTEFPGIFSSAQLRWSALICVPAQICADG
jgi:hypothetical protein